MQCQQCGKDIKVTDSDCPSCGAPTPAGREAAKENAQKDEVIRLVKRAMNGDDSVWSAIYEKTNRYVYFLALRFLRNEQDAQDVTQEVYIQAIRSVGQIYTPDAFFGWLRSIINSKCKDFLRKKKPELLSEDETVLENVPEINEEFLPEDILNKAETGRMILEIIDALPYLQRQTVMFYYYDGMAVDQIAALMECSPGTVKSRLNYARQQIKKAVEEHERKGIKLYGMGAIPILSILLREQAKAMQLPPNLSGGLSPILEQTANTPPDGTSGQVGPKSDIAGQVTKEAAKKGIPLATKIIAAIVAGMIIIGGIVAVILLTNGDNTGSPDLSGTGSTQQSESDQSETQSQNNRDYLTLTDAQRALLERLAKATKEYNYEAAYDIFTGATFLEIKGILPDTGAAYVLINDNEEWELLNDIAQNKVQFTAWPGGMENGTHFESSFRIYDDNVATSYKHIASIKSAVYQNGKANGEYKAWGYHPEYALVAAQLVHGTAKDGVAEGEFFREEYGADGSLTKTSVTTYVDGKPVSLGQMSDGRYWISKDKDTGAFDGDTDNLEKVFEIK